MNGPSDQESPADNTGRKRPRQLKLGGRISEYEASFVRVSLLCLVLSTHMVEGFTHQLPKKELIQRATFPSLVPSTTDFRDVLDLTADGWNTRSSQKALSFPAMYERATVLTHSPTEWLLKELGIDEKEDEEDGSEKRVDAESPLLFSPEPDEEDGSPICRLVTYSDGKLPAPSKDVFPSSLFVTPHVLRRLDDIYHASVHEETRLLSYLKDDEIHGADKKEDEKLVDFTRSSLEDAGFSLLTRRDLDLCEALNVGYLLRLSIVPDVATLDDGIAQEFYPERFDQDGNPLIPEDLLFDGRVLVYRRGYSEEITRGRLLLPKIDYIQASLVQRSVSWIKRGLEAFEDSSSRRLKKTYRAASGFVFRRLRKAAGRVPVKFISTRLLSVIPSQVSTDSEVRKGTSFFKLARYGGSKKRFVSSGDPFDALAPFEEVKVDEATMFTTCPTAHEDPLAYDENFGRSSADREIKCSYDVGSMGPDLSRPPMQVIKRATISNLVDVFSRDGRRKLLRSLVSKSKIVEPTYDEVVVIWRPRPDVEEEKRKAPLIRPPKILYELADMFDVEGFLPPEDTMVKAEVKMPIQVRNFEGVPMSNLPAVLPKTKLVFRPEDAFKNDFVSIITLLLVLSAQSFDSPKLDLLAFVSVALWLLRTVIRYSNKLARYDLLVKTFLTSKISHRNSGALRYIANEAGSQRASRAALAHEWLCRRTSQAKKMPTRAQLLREGSQRVNDLIKHQNGRQIPVDIDAALNDLEDLGLISFGGEQQLLTNVETDSRRVVKTLKVTWDIVFDGKMGLGDLMGRRRQVANDLPDPLGEFQ